MNIFSIRYIDYFYIFLSSFYIVMIYTFERIISIFDIGFY